MNTLVHMVIAKDIIKEVENALNLKAKKLSFIYGSARPDIRKDIYNTNHYREDLTVNYVYDMMEKVFTEFSEKNNVSEFYMSLGAVIHFICDFFCYPHNSYYDDGRYNHHKYELKQTILLTERKKYNEEFDKTMEGLDFDKCKAFVESLHKEYEEIPPNYATDYLYAYKACRCIVLSAVKIYVKEKSQKKEKKMEAKSNLKMLDRKSVV